MTASYKKLWEILASRDLMKEDLGKMAGRLVHGDNVATDVLERICKALNVTADGIMEFIDG